MLAADQVLALGQTGKERDKRFPNIPTFQENGAEGFDASYWFALLIPSDTPAPVKAKWDEAMAKVLADPEVQEKLNKVGLSPYAIDPAQAEKILLNEVSQWEDIVKKAGIQTN